MRSPLEEQLEEQLDIRLSKAACLLLFELLTNAYEAWRAENPQDSSAGAMLVRAEEHAERQALWQLESALERMIPELFSTHYGELVTESKRLLS